MAYSSCGIFGHKQGSTGFECAAAYTEGRPETTTRPQGAVDWIQVNRKKGKFPSAKSANQTQPTTNIQMEPTSAGDLLPVLNPASEPGMICTDLNHNKEAKAGPSHSSVLDLPGCVDQQIEDLAINSQSSTGGSSDSQEVLENSASEELVEEEPAVISPQTPAHKLWHLVPRRTLLKLPRGVYLAC